MRRAKRWSVAILATLGSFGLVWWRTDSYGLETDVSLGLAALVSSTVFGVLAWWAGREKQERPELPQASSTANLNNSPSAQGVGAVSGGIVIGPGSFVDFGRASLGPSRDHGDESSDHTSENGAKAADESPKAPELLRPLIVFRTTINITESFTRTEEVEIYAQEALDQYVRDILPKGQAEEG